MKTFVGLADCYGIESLFQVGETHIRGKQKQDLSMLNLRAEANRQRHALVFKVRLTDESAEMVEKLLEEQKSRRALLMVKRLAKKVWIHRGQEKSWKLIPNPKLDPYG